MMYKSMNNMTPTYLSDLFACSSQFQSRDLRGSDVNLRQIWRQIQVSEVFLTEGQLLEIF